MMKRLVCALLTLTLLTVCTACFDNPSNDPTVPTTTTVPRDTTTVPTTTTTASPLPTETTVPTDPPPTDTVYNAETLPFSVVLPASWQGAYAVREENSSVRFYELNNHLYDGSGHLFTIRFINAAVYEDDMFPSYEYLGKFGEQCVVAMFPTDMQSSADYLDTYNAMFDDVEGILETFTYTG